MSNMFEDLSTEGLEESTDVLGGGGPLESGAYDSVIKMAYVTEAASEARAINLVLDVGGRDYWETIYVTSGKAKGKKNYYERDGKKYPLPGFTTVNDLCLLATGKDLAKQDIEEKVVNVYDFDARKEVPTKVPVITSIIGEKVKVGIVKIRENKSKKNESTGAYEPTSEERLINEISKVFHHETNKTVSEYINKTEEATFFGKWMEKHNGVLTDKYKEVSGGGSSGKPGSSKPSSGKATTSLFGDE